MMSLKNDLRDLFEIGRHPLKIIGTKPRLEDGFSIEELVFETADGEAVRGMITKPADANNPLPAILYGHGHGNRYDIGIAEMLEGRRALQSPMGPALARAGFISLMVELPTFGTRASQTESALSKALLWQGKTLAGQMLGEQASALDYLVARADVDGENIGVFGISMGATLGYWLAAVDERIKCAMHECCYADFATLIETGAHDLHGAYLTLPGLLNMASNGEIAGLIAPRAQLICTGDEDPLAPPLAVDRAFAQTRAAYQKRGALEQLYLHREINSGHQETAAMRQRVLEFAAEHLQ